MKIYNFVEPKHQGEYLIAEQIIEIAKSYGFVPYISTDGKLHPSSMCNRYMHQILRNQALRLRHHLDSNSMIRIMRNVKSETFLAQIAERMGKNMSMFSSGKLNLYSVDAAYALICTMSQKSREEVSLGNDVELVYIPHYVDIERKTVETRKERNITSIFGRKNNG